MKTTDVVLVVLAQENAMHTPIVYSKCVDVVFNDFQTNPYAK